MRFVPCFRLLGKCRELEENVLRPPSPVPFRKRALQVVKEVPRAEALSGLLLFLERIHPFQPDDSLPFIPFTTFQNHPFFGDEESGLKTWVTPNPWLAIPPEVWPFPIRDEGRKPIEVAVWPERARHDSKRWIRSLTPERPLATFKARFTPENTVVFHLETHLDFQSTSLSSPEGRECLSRFRMEEGFWEACWAAIPGGCDSPEKASEAYFLWSQRNRVHVSLPSVSIQTRITMLKEWMSKYPRIAEEQPLAAAALAGWDWV